MKCYKDKLTESIYIESLEDGEIIQFYYNDDGTISSSGEAIVLDELVYEVPEVIDGKEVNMYEHLTGIYYKLKNDEDLEEITETIR